MFAATIKKDNTIIAGFNLSKSFLNYGLISLNFSLI